jgi:RNA polymerase sigma-70 factor, ECF subfamily
MPTETDDLLRTRKTLLSRLKDLDDQAIWRKFFDAYWRLIYNVARKAGFNDAAAQDIVMETFAVVARQISNYDREKGSFKGWLLQIARTRTIDALRRKHYRHDGEYIPREQPLNTPLLEAQCTEATLNTIWDDELRSHHLQMAMDVVKRNADAHQFQLFFLHVVKGVPALQVARRLGAKLPEVYFAKYKISARLKKEIKRLEKNSP